MGIGFAGFSALGLTDFDRLSDRSQAVLTITCVVIFIAGAFVAFRHRTEFSRRLRWLAFVVVTLICGSLIFENRKQVISLKDQPSANDIGMHLVVDKVEGDDEFSRIIITSM